MNSPVREVWSLPRVAPWNAVGGLKEGLFVNLWVCGDDVCDCSQIELVAWTRTKFFRLKTIWAGGYFTEPDSDELIQRANEYYNACWVFGYPPDPELNWLETN